MGRIPQSFIDQLLDRVDLVDVIDRRVPLKKAGKTYKACCPFHNEKTPSFNVNPDKQFYHCFGCGAGGNAIGFVMDYDNVDFPTAVEDLANQLGLEVPREQTTQADKQRQQQAKNAYQIVEQAHLYYKQQLRTHSEKQQAIDYLKSRGLTGQLAKDFGLGFAPAGWDNLLQAAKNWQSGSQQYQETLAKLEENGLLIKKEDTKAENERQYYDRFRHRIIFPIRDNRGRVIAFGGRVLSDDKPKYLNSPETTLFHKANELYGLYEARQKNRNLQHLILVEGYMDVVSLFQFGITCAIATLGTASGIAHLEKIFRHTSKLVVCFDSDQAGMKAAERLLETALPALTDGREICFLFLPDGHDPDTFIREKGKDVFERQVDNALPLEDMLFELTQRDCDMNTSAGRAKACQKALPLLRQIPKGIFKQSIINQLAELTQVDKQAIAEQLEIAEQKNQRQSNNQRNGQNNKAAATQPTESAQRQATAHQFHKQNTETTQTPNRQAQSSTTPTTKDETLPPAILSNLKLIVSTFLFYPSTAIQVELPLFPLLSTAEKKHPILALADEVAEFIIQFQQDFGQLPTMAHIIGNWHDGSASNPLTDTFKDFAQPENDEIAYLQLNDAIDNINNVIKEGKQSQLLDNLKQKSVSQLSEQEKRFLKTLGKTN